MIGRYNKGNIRGKLDTKKKKKWSGRKYPPYTKKKKPKTNNNNNGFLGLRRGESQSAMPSDTTSLKPRRGATSSMQIISLGSEINCFEGMGLNSLCSTKILFH